MKTYDRSIYFPDEPGQQKEEIQIVQKNQRWKSDPTLHSCERDEKGRKKLKYHETYVHEFLEQDPVRDWESIDRCKELYEFFCEKIGGKNPAVENWSLLDCGTKDGQFPEWLNGQGVETLGIEIADDYINWCQLHNRPVKYGDVCDLPPSWTDKWDIVFGHHLLGLTPDYWKGLSEMLRVSKKYLVTLNDVPGNPRKHYSYIEDESIFFKFTEEKKVKEIFNGRWNPAKYPKEWVYIIEK